MIFFQNLFIEEWVAMTAGTLLERREPVDTTRETLDRRKMSPGSRVWKQFCKGQME